MSEPVLPDGWPRPRGYAEGRRAGGGRLLAVAGQLGVDLRDPADHSVPFTDQWRRALERVAAVVAAGGGTPARVLSLRVFVTDMTDYGRNARELGGTFRGVFGDHEPAITLVEVSGLAHPAARVEIEGLAVLDG